MAVCGVKFGNTKVFWKYWTKSDQKHFNTVTFIKCVKRCFVV